MRKSRYSLRCERERARMAVMRPLLPEGVPIVRHFAAVAETRCWLSAHAQQARRFLGSDSSQKNNNL